MFDRWILMLALLSFLICFIYVLYETFGVGKYIYDTIPYLSIPFVLCGVAFYLKTKKWVMIAIVVALLVMYLLGFSGVLLFFVVFLTVGAAGVVCIVEAIQRVIFYKVVHIIEYVNVKSKLSFFDRVVLFLFNVPQDLDTRNITLDSDLCRTSIPWKEMIEPSMMGMMLGLFLWIYVSMNPAFMDLATSSDIHVYMFTLILYIPLLVLPWIIFRSLDVRVETNYRDFKIYSGIKATLKRIALPVVAALFFVLLAFNSSDVYQVLHYIAFSAVMILVTIVITSLLYYIFAEPRIVGDIVSKWSEFRPISIFASLGEKNGSGWDDVPGTPRRDPSDFGDISSHEDGSD